MGVVLPSDRPTLVTVPVPQAPQPPEPKRQSFCCPASGCGTPPWTPFATPVAPPKLGISAPTNSLNVGAPALSLGAPQNVFAASLALVSVNVPDPVTGDPLTVNSPGAEKPTLETVAGGAPVSTTFPLASI